MSFGWSLGGSILTFLFPMLLFIAVAAALYVEYTKPTAIPGRRATVAEPPVTSTRVPGTAVTAAASGTPVIAAIPGGPVIATVLDESVAAEVLGEQPAAGGEGESPEATQ